MATSISSDHLEIIKTGMGISEKVHYDGSTTVETVQLLLKQELSNSNNLFLKLRLGGDICPYSLNDAQYFR